MSDLTFTASSGTTSYHQNLDQAAVIATALEQIFTSTAPASERRQAAVAYIRDAVERQTGESFPPLLDLREPPPSADHIVGISVQPSAICRRCGDPIAIVGPGTPPHAASLRCRSCDAFRGWLSRASAAFVASIVTEAGVPRHPIVLSANNDRDPVQARPSAFPHQQT